MSVLEINISLFRLINDLGKEYTFVNPVMIFVAEYMIYFLALGVIVLLFTRDKKNRMMIICAFITLVFAEILGRVAGKIHANNQPFAELANVNKLIEKAVNNSFPSDHTIIFFSFCVTFWLFKRGWGSLFILLAVLVGVSRIWVGVHYPGDVLVGAILSIISAFIVYRVVPKLSVTKKLLGISDDDEQLMQTSLNKTGDDMSNDF